MSSPRPRSCTITFKAKRHRQEYAGHPDLHSEWIDVPAIRREHCNIAAFRASARFGPYANSDLFPAMVKRELAQRGITGRLKFEDQFGRYELPEGVEVKAGWLDTVTITLDGKAGNGQ